MKLQFPWKGNPQVFDVKSFRQIRLQSPTKTQDSPQFLKHNSISKWHLFPETSTETRRQFPEKILNASNSRSARNSRGHRIRRWFRTRCQQSTFNTTPSKKTPAKTSENRREPRREFLFLLASSINDMCVIQPLDPNSASKLPRIPTYVIEFLVGLWLDKWFSFLVRCGGPTTDWLFRTRPYGVW